MNDIPDHGHINPIECGIKILSNGGMIIQSHWKKKPCSTMMHMDLSQFGAGVPKSMAIIHEETFMIQNSLPGIWRDALVESTMGVYPPAN